MTKLQKFWMAFVFLGIAMIVFSFIMPSLFSGKWDDAQAMEFSESHQELHTLLHQKEESGAGGHTHADGSFHAHDSSTEEEDPEIASAAQRYDANRQELDKAIAWHEKGPLYVRLVGAVFGMVGGLGWMATRPDASGSG